MKRIISLIIALVMCFSLSAAVFAESTDTPDEETTLELVIEDDQTRAEETEWYYRITGDGLFQRRLWSITYGYWKTDWITIGYV